MSELLFHLLVSVASAKVNLLTGALITPELLPLTGTATLRTQHSSRSLHRGLFGMGWCSDLEWTWKRSQNDIELQLCDHERINVKTSDVTQSWQGTAIRVNNELTVSFDLQGRVREIQRKSEAKLGLIYSMSRDRKTSSLAEITINQSSFRPRVSVNIENGLLIKLAELKLLYSNKDLIQVWQKRGRSLTLISSKKYQAHNIVWAWSALKEESYLYDETKDVLLQMIPVGKCRWVFNYPAAPTQDLDYCAKKSSVKSSVKNLARLSNSQ